MFYETMEELLPNMEIIIDTGDGSSVQKILPLDSFANITTSDTSSDDGSGN
jgi:membrane protease subunit HflK